MLNPDRRSIAETSLLHLLARRLAVPPEWPAVEKAIQERLATEGRFVLLGRTGALRELMVWGRQREVLEPVDLPDRSLRVRVIYLEDFTSLGWGDWATCGRRGAGGWATGNALHAVTPRYASLLSEEFRVTFLRHEAQHSADLARFPGLSPWELEYRAKLTELAQVRTTRMRVLRKFLEDQSAEPSHPHGYANRKVLRDVADRLRVDQPSALTSVDVEALNAAATALHREDSSARLQAAE